MTNFYMVRGDKRAERWYYCSQDCARKHWPGIDDVDIEPVNTADVLRWQYGLTNDPDAPGYLDDEKIVRQADHPHIHCDYCHGECR